ncbi:putative heterochromatin protein 1 protein [Botrytis fragariae]|uniref:Putative heterochromatin protein 1 protein n=1 Tax=Botrytis fragariae TaxID=1964551 RepID=A0A8H6AU03_9HELO|nr:putative heterochromatin protein 1 protein [Botrytis fragariae]KAF5873582.1 putative heterochromatin protein 1 protein [Botrytis fragariae]
MARLNNTLIVYKRKPYKPVPSLVAAHRRNTLESRKGNGTENGGVAKKGKQATTPGESSVQKPSGTANQLNNMVGSRALVAQMIVSTTDGEETNKSSTEQVMIEPKAHVEERGDGEGDGQKDKEDNEAEVQNKPQQEVALPNPLQSRGPSTTAKKALAKRTAELQNSRLRQEKRTPLSRLKRAQHSTPDNKLGLTEDLPTEKDTPRGEGSRRKLAGAMLTSGKEAEIVASAKKPKPSGNPIGNPKALAEVLAPVKQAMELAPVVEQTKEPTPVAEQTEEPTPVAEQTKEPTPVAEQAKGLTSIVEQAEDEDGSEEENVTETKAKNSYQPDIVHQSRLDGENNKQWLIEWKGYPKQKDWTWESVEMLREDCPEWVEEKENGSLNGDADVHEVEAILDKRKVRGKVQYRVKWEGWEANYNTWEPAEMLECDVPYMVEDFEKELKKTEKKRSVGKADMDAELPAAKKRGRPRK